MHVSFRSRNGVVLLPGHCTFQHVLSKHTLISPDVNTFQNSNSSWFEEEFDRRFVHLDHHRLEYRLIFRIVLTFQWNADASGAPESHRSFRIEWRGSDWIASFRVWSSTTIDADQVTSRLSLPLRTPPPFPKCSFVDWNTVTLPFFIVWNPLNKHNQQILHFCPHFLNLFHNSNSETNINSYIRTHHEMHNSLFAIRWPKSVFICSFKRLKTTPIPNLQFSFFYEAVQKLLTNINP